MARNETIITTDDIDGTEGASAVRFGFEGRDYVIDLSPQNYERLVTMLDPFITAGTRERNGSKPRKPPVRTPRAKQNGEATHTHTPSSHEVREWARQNGVAVGVRGRPNSAAVAAYVAAQRGA